MSILSKERIAEITGLHVKETSFGQKHAPAAYSTVYSWEIVELAKMVEALTSQLESVVAENAALKAAVTQQIDLRAEIKKAGRPPHADFWVQSICEAEEKVNRALEETPVTDSFLAEVRASGVEMFVEDFTQPDGLSNGKFFNEDLVDASREFAAQLRQGGAV